MLPLYCKGYKINLYSSQQILSLKKEYLQMHPACFLYLWLMLNIVFVHKIIIYHTNIKFKKYVYLILHTYYLYSYFWNSNHNSKQLLISK